MWWNASMIDTLRRVAADGGSYSDAAHILGVSRHAVAGKANREGIVFSFYPTANKRSEAAHKAWRTRRSRLARSLKP